MALSEIGAQIAPSTYYAALNRGASGRSVTDACIVDVLRTRHGRNEEKAAPESIHGHKKMWHWLRRNGHKAVARCTVERLMRQEGMRGAVRLKRVRTTRPPKDAVRAGDVLNRNFTAPAPNRAWITYFIYVRTWSGFVYTAFVFDVFSQKTVAFNVASEKTTPLVQTCLDMAIWSRKNADQPVNDGLIHHSDYAEVCVKPGNPGLACAGAVG
ncbi:DDE-type integrase/transposase/recombinase [Pseudarthrobacter sp. NPDC058196]|uniref:DDE-type integrase/transposase/recombinase n=1 Tax=Pseudarthrobacter sp. NPDC058196 TaxID=3346376 RepID=UPI0036DE130A